MTTRESYMSQVIPEPKAATPYPDYQTIVHQLLLHGAEMACGEVTGTGSNIDVSLPFDPAVVIVFNVTDLSIHFATPTTGAAKTVEIKAAVTVNATNGITLGSGTFRIGTSADLNTGADALHWVAVGFRNVSGVSS